MKIEKSTGKTIMLSIASLLFFVMFALAVFIVVWLLVPNKPSFFNSIRIDGIDSKSSYVVEGGNK